VQNAYLLMLAATVITCGRLGDILGRRRVYISGVLIFSIGTLVAALSTGEEMLIGARLIRASAGPRCSRSAWRSPQRLPAGTPGDGGRDWAAIS
jgi:MFS family permease